MSKTSGWWERVQLMSVNIFVVGIWERISRKDSLPAKVSVQLPHGEERCLRNVKEKKKKKSKKSSLSRISNLPFRWFR